MTGILRQGASAGGRLSDTWTDIWFCGAALSLSRSPSGRKTFMRSPEGQQLNALCKTLKECKSIKVTLELWNLEKVFQGVVPVEALKLTCDYNFNHNDR